MSCWVLFMYSPTTGQTVNTRVFQDSRACDEARVAYSGPASCESWSWDEGPTAPPWPSGAPGARTPWTGP